MTKPIFRGALLALLITLALSPASAQQVWKWSQTPASNATADPAINWITGMAPSAVSPSARAMMAAVAKYRDDTGGRLTTGGTGTAYTVVTNGVYAATPADGTRLALTIHATSGASPTLAADGGTAFPVQASLVGSLPAGTLVATSPYDVVFNSVAGAWLLVGVLSGPTAVPIGAILDYAGTTAPNSNFALAYGQCISRTTYATLFTLVGITFGSCDGATTFGLPDLRGRVVAGLDNMGGSAAGLITVAGGNFDGTNFGLRGGAQNHTLSTAEIPAFTPAGTVSTVSVSGSIAPATYTPAGSISSFNPAGTINAFTPSGTVNITGGTVGGTAGGAAAAAGGQDIVINHTTIGTNFVGNGITLSGSSVTPSFTGTAQAFSFSGNPVTPTFSGNSIGGGGFHSILPPMMVLSKIIRLF